jgi:hypothetical protein
MLPPHPAIVHVPLGLALAVPAVLVALTIALFRRKAAPRPFLVAALLQAIVLGGGLLALATGNPGGRERWARGFAIAGTAASAGVFALGLAVGHAGGSLVYDDGAASADARTTGQAGAPASGRAAGGGVD